MAARARMWAVLLKPRKKAKRTGIHCSEKLPKTDPASKVNPHFSFFRNKEAMMIPIN